MKTTEKEMVEVCSVIENPSVDLVLCSPPLLDLNGLCHCLSHAPGHVPVLIPRPGQSFPPCRDPGFRVAYIDDALVAQAIELDKVCVRLIPTLGPHGKMAGGGLGIPGPCSNINSEILI